MKPITAWAVMDKGVPVAQSWNEQYCIYTKREDAQKSITEFHTKRPGETVVKVIISEKAVARIRAREKG